MASSAIRTSAPTIKTDTAPPASAAALIPGILLLAVVGYAGKFIEQFIAHYGKAHHLVLPNIEYVLWAILIGLVISNTVGIPAIFRSGVATYEFWLKAGIVLLGARFLLGDVRRLGGLSLVLIAIELVLALTFMTYLGRAFKLKPKLVSLLAVGSSICGVSAIIAAQGAIDADEEDSSYAIAAILLLGAISLFLFPLVGHCPAPERSCLRLVGRAGGGQYSGGDGCRSALLGRGRQGRGAGQDLPQRHHRIYCSGLRDLLGGERPGC